MRKLGIHGPEVSAISLGTRWDIHSAGEWQQSKKHYTDLLHKAVDAGINFMNTADFYSRGVSEMAVGEILKERRKEVFVSVKTGTLVNPRGGFLGLDGRPAAIKNFCAYSLMRLGVDEIDLLAPARVDPNVPIEETVGAIKDLIDEGKVRYLGLSEANAEQLRRAHQVHPVAALEIEYSLATRFIEREILPVARELGVAVVPYSVYYYGLLTGNMRLPLAQGDYKNMLPRFQGENLVYNLQKVEWLKAFAAEKGVSAGQVALAWLLQQGEDIIPVVGMNKVARIQENLDAMAIQFTEDEMGRLNEAFKHGALKGERYPPLLQAWAAS